jgi:tetratricopeptide (TPR) repeat protein/KaiC/GvpD/RAD55 family RecA-like ATPase
LIALSERGLAEPGFVGREKELEELESFLNEAIAGQGKTVFISGEAGNGKTRLVRELLRVAQEKNAAVLTGWCISDASSPYFPFAQAFNTFFSDQKKNKKDSEALPVDFHSENRPSEIEDFGITAWLTGMRSADKNKETAIVSPQVWKDQLFLAVGKTLESISTQKPLVLFIDDIHWADSASLSMLHFISRTISSKRILVLATFRSEELTTDIEGHPHPLAETLRMMRYEDVFKELILPSINQSDVSKIAENMMGGSLQNEFAEKLSKESHGNPLFIVESLKMLQERKSLINENNKWRLVTNELGIPSKVRDVILRRVATLNYAQRRVLDAASVIGGKFDVELLSKVLGLDILDVLETLNALAHSTSLIIEDGDHYSFDHSRSRETLYEELSSPLKKGYHIRVAEKLESSKENNLPLSEIAYHYSQAGVKDKAVKYSLAAGKDALQRWANSEAIRHFTYVLNNIGDSPENVAVKMIALEGLGDAYAVNCRFDKAIETYEKLAASTKGHLKLHAYIKAMEVAWYKEYNPNQLMQAIKNIEGWAKLDPLENARMIWNRGRAFLFLMDFKRALDDHEEALQLFEEEYSLSDVANLLAGTGAVRGVASIKLEDSNTEFERAFSERLLGTALTHELGPPQAEATYINIFIAGTFYSVGLFQEALDSFSNSLQISEKTGDFSNASLALTHIGELLSIISANEAEGTPQLIKALEYALKTDSKLTQSRIYASISTRFAKLGDLERAEGYYRELAKIPPETVSNAMIVATTELANCVMPAARNHWNEANERFNKTIEVFQSLLPQNLGTQIILRKNFAWMLERQGLTKEAEAQISEAYRLSEKIKQRLARSKIFSNFMIKKRIVVGQEVEMRFDVVNVATSVGLLARINDVIPPELEIVSLPDFCIIDGNAIVVKDKSIDPFQVVTIKIRVRAKRPGNYQLTPTIEYINNLMENKAFTPKPATIEVSQNKPTFEILENRVATGYAELDRLLLGGIPRNYAVILSSPSTDERALLVSKFLRVGTEQNEITCYVTVDAEKAKALAKEYPSNFFAVICNPQVNAIVGNLSNVFRLNGLENLTEIDIALTKLFRMLNPNLTSAKRIYIEVISDVLLQHHAVDTRRWISALLPILKSKGFTVLAIINPHMHPYEENQAITSLFDGEIEITREEKQKSKVLKVKKLVNQRYLTEQSNFPEINED